ncbi:MAG TPA: dihydroneopterin aldolase [Candidatus Baltobacteraceae bacterium]
MDRISLRGMRVYGRHGANPGEREGDQPFDIDLVLDIDLRPAERSDELADTLNYDALHQTLAGVVRATSYALLERLAGELLDEVFRDPRVAAAELTIGKPGLLDGATPAITLRRQNPRH